MFWREASGGSSVVAYFLTKNLIFILDAIALPLIFGTVIRVFLTPQLSVATHFSVLLLISWSTTGLGLMISTLVPPASSLLVGVMAPLVLGGFLSGASPVFEPLSVQGFLATLSFNRFATQYSSVMELWLRSEQSTAVAIVGKGALTALKFPLPCVMDAKATEGSPGDNCVQDSALSLLLIGLLVQGLAYRLICFLALQFKDTEKRV
jgi:hypothetical protein